MNLSEEERIIRKGLANHLTDSEGAGGRLLLTNKRLIFKSHAFNFRIYEQSIPLENIISIVTPHSDLISKKLAILLVDGSIEFFIVNKRKTWLREIEDTVICLRKIRGENWSNNKEANQRIIEESHALLIRMVIFAIIIGILTEFSLLFVL